ncbi:hypothetical protein DPMN_052839 [Dreissena polymorpha]|uniref:Uncharacterized protein n=1 Tax=Dreissena polymorpha TaxID=45954 RepID=A0A9D4HRN0_DREPO|nr:hypothetical protein DPMN_052839 [Dreissena polymorpha]
MSSCADVFIELLSTKNKLLSADTWMMPEVRNLSVLVSKNADQPWDVELTDDSNRAEQRRKRRRRLKKRNIAEKVNGTCKQDFTCRNGLIAVPTVNKDFICCETTQQKIQVSGVDRKMCLKKEFYYCDSTLQKQGFNCRDVAEMFCQLVTEKKFSSCVSTVATSCLLLGRCQQCSAARRAVTERRLNMQHNTKMPICKP